MGSHSRWRWSDYRRVCRTSTEALGRVLDAAEDASPLEAVEAVTADLSAALKASAAFFLIADVSGRGLVRLSQASADPVGVRAELGGSGGRPRLDDDEQAVDLPVAGGGAAAEALRTQTVQVLPPGGRGREGERWEVLAPVTERGEALGLLQLSLPREPNAAVLSEISRIAHVLSFVVIANRRHTDLFEWAQRSALFTLPAEIQRRLLPAAFTCEAGALTLSAWLEPAASIGGDTFDYSLARDLLHLSVTDAMGHGVASALTATLCVGSLRNTRRMGGTLLEQAAAANRALVEDGSRASLGGLRDWPAGPAGPAHRHPHAHQRRARRALPVPRRDGHAAGAPVNLPLGLFIDTDYESTDLVLERGDRLVVVTDGMLERGAATLDLIAEIGQTRALHPRETTRRLTDKVLQTCGPTLADDATLLVLDWHGGHGRNRATVAGADPSRASAASRAR